MDKIITYFEFYILIFLLLIVSIKNEKEYLINRKKIFIIFYWAFIIVFSFRTTGDDYQPYVTLFNDFTPVSFKQMLGLSVFKYDIEFFWVSIISVIKILGLNYRFFFFIAILIPLLSIRIVITEKESQKLLFCFFWYIIFNFEDGTNIVRQFAANNIWFLVLFLYSKNKKKKGISLQMCNCLIHNAAFVGLPSIIICKKKYRNSIYYLVFGGVIFLSWILSVVLQNLSFNYSHFADNRLLFKLFYYLFSYQKIRTEMNIPLITKIIDINLYTIKLIIKLLVVFYALNIKKMKSDNFCSIILNSEYLGLILYIMGVIFGVKTIGTRLANFLSIGEFYLVFSIIKYQKKYSKKMYFFILFLLLSFLRLLFNLLHNMYLGNPNSPFYLNISGLV